MATTKPRITVTLSHRQHEVLKAISDCGGQPMSTFISEMLELSLPTLERMAATFQKIKRVQDQQRESIRDALDDAQSALEPIALSAVGQFDLFMSKLEEATGAEDRRLPSDPERTEGTLGVGGTVPEAPSAPATNRGATPRKPKPAKPTAARVSAVFDSEKKLKTKGIRTA